MRLPNRILLLGSLLTSAANAETTNNTATPVAGEPARLEPVRVTADLWQTPVEQLSASVSVIEGADLARTGALSFGNLTDSFANLTATGASSRPRYFQIRGIGENSQFEGETPDSSVGFKVDDLDFTGLGGLGSTFDVRQVEVLRGPQAGAFGANAAGGLIRIVTNDPTPYWTGTAQVSLGQDHLREAGVAVGGPVLPRSPETLTFRLALQQHASDGFRRNLTLDRRTNALDELFGRLKVAFKPNDAWHWDAAFLAADQDNGYDVFSLDNNGRDVFSDEPGRDTQESYAGSLRGTWDAAPDLTFSTVSNGTWTDSLYSYDSDWTDDSYAGFVQMTRDRRTLSQELRLDGNGRGLIDRWTVGLFAQRLDETGSYFYRDQSWGVLETLDYDYRSDNAALFGQAAHDFTRDTRLILGLRAERVELSDTSRYDDFSSPVSLSPEFDGNLWGGKLTLEHDFSERLLGFASVARGYKAGGVNVDARIDTASGDPVTYGTETLYNYEVGARGNWFDRTVTGELTAFYLDRQEAQVRDSAGFGGNYRFFTDNGDRAHVYGLEGSAGWTFAEHWKLHGSLGLMESRLDAFTLSNGNTATGGRLANTPKLSHSLGLRYRPPQGFFGDVSYSGRSSILDSNNQNEARRAYGTVDLSLGYVFGSWTASAWARNLLDETYDRRVYFFGNDPAVGYDSRRYEDRAAPRQIGVTLAYGF